MIYVSRNRRDAHGHRIKPNEQWFKEARRLTKKARREAEAHVVTGHYRDPQVRMALKELFHGKCAYCEQRLPENFEIDHYRPKNRVAERPDHDGYYWLAYKWTNLYPACTYCNQKRKDPPQWDDQQTGEPQGKCDQFPIHEESKRAMRPSDPLADELPYLLDPCDDEPSLYLQYNPLGEIESIDGDVFGEETIRICHLYRTYLNKARARKITRCVGLLVCLRKLEEGDWPEERDIVQELLDEELAVDAEFAGLALALYEDPERFGVAD